MANSTSTNGAVFLTIPANSNWNGIITLAASLTVAAGGSAASVTPTVTLKGAAQNFNDGDVMAALQLAASAALVTALTGTQVVDSIAIGPFSIQTGVNSVTAQLNITGTGANAMACAIGQVI